MMYDSIIVGGGPAGGISAYYLAKEGYNVLLLEKHKVPRYKPCGGSISWRIIRELPFDISSVLLNEIKGVRFFSPSLKHVAEVEYNHPIGFTTLRDKFDEKILKEAERGGVTVLDNTPVTKVLEDRNKVKVFLQNGEILNTKVVIGADGVNSIVAKTSGIRRRWLNHQLAITLSTLLENANSDDSFAEFYFGPERAFTMGYGWIFPVKEQYNVGFGGGLHDTHELKQKFHNFLKNNKKTSKKNVEKVYSALVPFRDSILDTPYTNRIVLIGDAAGYVNGISGEGIYHALVSGRIVAKKIANALEMSDVSKEVFKNYFDECMNIFGYEVEKEGVIHKLRDSISADFNKIEFFTKMLKRDMPFRKHLVELFYALDEPPEIIKRLNSRKWIAFAKSII